MNFIVQSVERSDRRKGFITCRFDDGRAVDLYFDSIFGFGYGETQVRLLGEIMGMAPELIEAEQKIVKTLLSEALNNRRVRVQRSFAESM